VTPLLVLAVAVGGALGAVLRHLASVSLAGRGRIPWGVLVVNVVGSFIAGLALGLPLDATLKLLVLTGFCGGLTTFSTLSVDTVQLVLDGKGRRATLSVGLNFGLGMLVTLVGMLAGSSSVIAV